MSNFKIEIKFDFRDYTTTTEDFTIDKSKPLWYHYFLCGFAGVLEHMPESRGNNGFCFCSFTHHITINKIKRRAALS